MANPYALDFNPLASAITDNQQLDLARNRLAMDQKRLGFEEARLGMERERHPVTLEGLRLGNRQAEQTINFEKEKQPVLLQGLKLENSGRSLQNQSTAQSIQAKGIELQKELAGRAAAIGQMVQDEPDPVKQAERLRYWYAKDPVMRAEIGKILPKELIDDPVAVTRYLARVNQGFVGPQVKTLKEGEKMGVLEPDINNPKSPGNFRTIAENPKNEGFKDEHQLRQELNNNPIVKNMAEIKSGYGRIIEGRKLGSGVGDISIVFGYMKMLDPTSVVREGEYATAANAAGIPEKILNAYNRALRGEQLPKSLREEFERGAESLYSRALSEANKVGSYYSGLATKYKLDPSRVVPDFGLANPPKQEPDLPRFNPAPRGMQDVINGRGIDKPVQERLAPAPQQTQMPRLPAGPEGDAVYNSLPSGAQYIAPDGSTRTKR